MIASRLLFVAAAALMHDCKPDNQDIGQGALFVWPFVALFALLVQRVLLGLWQPLAPKLALDARPVLVGIGVALLAPFLVGLHATGSRWQLWSLVMLWMFGASYTSVVLLFTRMLLFIDERLAETMAQLLATVAFIPLAVILKLDLWVGAPRFLSYYWYVGYGGVGTTVIFGVLLGEVVIRRVVRASAKSPPAAEPRSEGD